MSTVLKNAGIINVFTEELLLGDVLIEGNKIMGVGEYDGDNQVDCTGKYICPGLIDAHVHIESSMASPIEFAKTILPYGTTTIICDPHEMVNVAGAKGIEYLLEVTENAPVDVYVMLPSSVPATEFETNGADFTIQDMQKFIDHPRVLGLGEVMCYQDVIAGKSHILDKIALFKDKIIDGHAPMLTGHDLQSYIAAGIRTDHECTDFQETMAKIQAGMKILVREGSSAKNLKTLIKGIIKNRLAVDNFMFCTDDKHIDDIKSHGHISENVQKAVELGLSPIKAIKMASYSAACTYGLRDKGAIAPGYCADLLILNSLNEFDIHQVYKKGIPITETYLTHFHKQADKLSLSNTVNFADIKPEQIQIPVTGTSHVIQILPGQVLTKHLQESVPANAGFFVANQIYSKLCVVERHRGSGNIATAIVKDFGICNGALATTVAHDSHNVIAIGDNDRDLCRAINETKKIGGGCVVVSNFGVIAKLPLPLAGLMSDKPADGIIKDIADIRKALDKMGIGDHIDPLMILSFLALPVIPEIRLTDKGLFDVNKYEFLY